MNNIVLIGFMGTGKTTVGKLLSEKLNFDFIDIDEEIKRRCSMNIGEIFNNYGEKFFRNMEELIVKEISSVQNCVISTGGGIILNPDNINYLKRNGIIFWLKASEAKILSNLMSEESQIKDRPLLKAENIKQIVTQLLYIRETYYNQSYNHMICIDKMLPSEVADLCINLYNSS